MSSDRRSWSNTTPLLGEQSQHNQYFQNHSHSTSPDSFSPVSFLEMTSYSFNTTPQAPPRPAFLGIDVGTGSARAGHLSLYIPLLKFLCYMIHSLILNLTFSFLEFDSCLIVFDGFSMYILVLGFVYYLIGDMIATGMPYILNRRIGYELFQVLINFFYHTVALFVELEGLWCVLLVLLSGEQLVRLDSYTLLTCLASLMLFTGVKKTKIGLHCSIF